MVRLTPLQAEPKPVPPTLCFTRSRPKISRLVPPVKVPLYWFDAWMVQKKLIFPIPPRVFICDGRRFVVIAQSNLEVGMKNVTRWLVYEEHPDLPNKGRP